MSFDFDIISQVSSNLTLKKVGIEEFCESEEFCGKRLYPRQRLLLKLIYLEELSGKEEDILTYWINGGRNGSEINLSPFIRERIQHLREENYEHFREVVLVGGRRSSKGFCTGLAMAKLMHSTLQLQDPGMYYGIDPDKEIYFSCVAASQDQAKKYQYSDFSSTVSGCGAMIQHITKVHELEFSVQTDSDKRKLDNLKRQGKKIGRDVSKLRGVALAANASTIRGSATIGIVFDEMAHMMNEGESSQTADAVYEAAIPSLAQFGKDAMIFANSSPYTKLGKFYERYEEAMKLDDERKSAAAPLMMAMRFPSWALFEGWQDDPLRRFRKCVTVSPDWDPEAKTEDGRAYHSPDDRDAIVIAREEERQEPEQYKVERRGQFAEVIDAYLRPEAVDQAFAGLPELTDAGEVVYHPIPTNWGNPSYMYRYKAHLDPSSTTAGFGFAMGHIEVLENEFGQSNHVVFDIVKRWAPKDFPEGVVDWEIVLDELMLYIELFRPYEVTFDQFQSHAPIQALNRQIRDKGWSGIRVYEKTATAQNNWHRAEIFRTALYQGVIHVPHDTHDTEYAELELKYLQQVNTSGRFPRVDKQEIGPVQTKDMADCMMEVVEGLIGNIMAREARESLGFMPPGFGAPGGFNIGGPDRGGYGKPSPFADLYAKRTGEQRSVGGARQKLGELNNPARRKSWDSRRMPRW